MNQKLYSNKIKALKEARKQNKHVEWLEKVVEQKGRTLRKETFNGIVATTRRSFLVKKRFYYLVN